MRSGLIFHATTFIAALAMPFALLTSAEEAAEVSAALPSALSSADQPVELAASWTQYAGTNGNWKAAPTTKEYLRDWSKAKLVWESDISDIGSGRGQSDRYGARNGVPSSINPSKGLDAHGGCASPIIYDGRLYQFWMRPVGDTYSEDVVAKVLAEPNAQKLKGFDPAHVKKLFSVEAANVVACIDLVTGKTLWRKEFEDVPYSAASGIFAKPRGSNNTPAAGDGRMIYVMGYDAIMRALDATTGEQVWQYGTAADATTFAPPVRYADGVVLYLRGSGVTALDAATGEKLYHIKDAITSREAVAIWRHAGKTYFITSSDSRSKTPGQIKCFEAKTGTVIWTLDGKAPTFNPIVDGDYLLINESTTRLSKDSMAVLGLYQLSLTEAKQLWTLTDERYISNEGNIGRVIHDGKVIVGGRCGGPRKEKSDKQERGALMIIDAESGKMLTFLKTFEGVEKDHIAKDAMLIHLGDLLFIENDSHHESDVIKTIYDFKTETVTQYASTRTSGGYGGTAVNHPIVDGRLYMRCSDGKIRCFDVTKK